MTEIFASHRPWSLTGFDGVLLVGLGGAQLISGLALSTNWAREVVGALPGAVIDQPLPAAQGWTRDEDVVAVEPTVFVANKGE